ncbi:MAG: preprotein translocase subunit SecG [Candidatus Omnitrophica bacterium]|nr:preprotein translocase subunit SecG [Candidatus Omnitrophota bacterium]
MAIVLIVFHVVACIMLITMILFQAGRGGVADVFGGGAGQQFFGTQTADLLMKLTTGFAVTFILTSAGLTFLSARGSKSLMERAVQASATAIPAVPEAAATDASVDKTLAELAETTEEATAAAAATMETVDSAAGEVQQLVVESTEAAEAQATAAQQALETAVFETQDAAAPVAAQAEAAVQESVPVKPEAGATP